MMKDGKRILDKFLNSQDRLVFQPADLSLRTIAEMVDRGAIDIRPSYQRRERWSKKKQSALIESFLLNIPVPPIYLAEDSFGKYSLVDGQQRVSSVHAFMTEKIELVELENFTEIEGCKFSDLPVDIRNALEIRPYLRVITLLKQSDPFLKFEVFIRLNRGGEPIGAQELRNVAYRGELNELIYRLSENIFLRNQLKIRDKSSEFYRTMRDAELVLRFLTLRASWQRFNGQFNQEMDRFMIENQEIRRGDLTQYDRAFGNTIQNCEDIWGDFAFKRYAINGWRDQFITGMYDAQMIAVDSLSPSLLADALNNKEEIVRRTKELCLTSNFSNMLSKNSKVKQRIEMILDLLRV